MRKRRRQYVWDRAAGCCEYCRMPQEFDRRPFQIDHVRAQEHRGGTTLNNLALACMECNVHKSSNLTGYDPRTDTLQLLFNPRTDSWSRHFFWRGDILVGKTAKGRTKIECSESTYHHELTCAER